MDLTGALGEQGCGVVEHHVRVVPLPLLVEKPFGEAGREREDVLGSRADLVPDEVGGRPDVVVVGPVHVSYGLDRVAVLTVEHHAGLPSDRQLAGDARSHDRRPGDLVRQVTDRALQDVREDAQGAIRFGV